jgi:transcription elongation factor Elf1
MKHYKCPKCGESCYAYGMLGNSQSKNYFLCNHCRIAFYWVNRKGHAMFLDDFVSMNDDLYIHDAKSDRWLKQLTSFVLS